LPRRSRRRFPADEQRELAQAVAFEHADAAVQFFPAESDPAFRPAAIEFSFGRHVVVWQHEIDGEADPAAGVQIGEDGFHIGFPIGDGVTEPNVEYTAGERIVGHLSTSRADDKLRTIMACPPLARRRNHRCRNVDAAIGDLGF